MMVINKNIIETRFKKSINSYNNEAVVQKDMAIALASRLTTLNHASYSRVLEIGCGTGLLTNEILLRFAPNELILNDLVENMKNEISRINYNHEYSKWQFIPGDAEKLLFPGTFDLIVSASTFQWFKEPEKFFNHIGKKLDNKGILAFTTFGPRNLEEIKSLLNVGLNYPSTKELYRWLSDAFEIIECSEKLVQQQFATPLNVLKHIKQTGVNAIEKSIWTKGELSKFEDRYKKWYTNPNKSVTLTYNPIMVIAKKK